MTREQYVERLVIAMTSRVIGTDGTLDNSDTEHMLESACQIADYMEEYGYLDDDDDM